MNLVSKPTPAMTPASSRHDTGHSARFRADWRGTAIALAVSMVVVGVFFWDTALVMVETWYRSPTFNHGFLVLPIIGYLVWRRRAWLLSTPPRPDYRGLIAVAVIAFGWLLGSFADVLLVQQFALVGIVQLMCFTLLGWRATRIVAFPLLYLLFAVPAGEFMIQPLQDFTADFVVLFLRFIGIPVFLDGIFISIPTGAFEVAEACSGVRFLIASLALGFLFAHLSYRSLKRRAAFVALAFVVPIIANGFRAFGIVYIAYVTDNKVAVGVDHIVYGWVFFSVVTIILLAIGMTFREPEEDDEVRIAAAPFGPPTPLGRLRPSTAAIMAVLIATAAPAYASLIDAVPTPLVKVLLAAPPVGGGWERLPSYKDDWAPSFPGADDRLSTTYVKDGHSVHLFMAYYVRQRQGAELIGGGNSFVGKGRWARAQSGRSAAVLEDRPLPVAFDRLVRGDRNRLVWHWFWVGGEFTANRYRAKLLQAGSRLLGGAPPGAAIAVTTDYTIRRADAEAVLRDFVRNMPSLRVLLERTRR